MHLEPMRMLGSTCCLLFLALCLHDAVAAAEDGPPDGPMVERVLAGQSFEQVVERCLGDVSLQDVVVIVDAEQDGSLYLAKWAPDSLPQMAVSCLASETMKLAFPATSWETRFAYRPEPASGEPRVQILEQRERQPFEDRLEKGKRLLLQGMALTTVGNVFLTMAVALLPRMIIGSWDDDPCPAGASCGPGDRTWLAFDVLGLAAGLVMTITGASMMELGFQIRRGAVSS